MQPIDYQSVLTLLESTFTKQISCDSPTNLLCLKASENYIKADIKVMIFGQETNDWECQFPHIGGLPHLLNVYDNFFNNGKCFSYGGQFWNGFSKIQSRLRDEFSTESKSVGFIWNNVIKIGRCGEAGAPSKAVLDWQKITQNLIRKELERYKPDIVIFLSGPNYDKHIANIFNDVSFSKVSKRSDRQLAKVSSPQLPIKTIRTYHPGYLWRRGFYSF
ncbi:uracil-DNA glycosylase family protein [Pseudoalteromonas sp. T1lg10]|uniref:uracil-DNA glycosylase family protein n=1 Tax=Pseudoalteromonas sp. T1lg10 TaxID=2077093 RepID=UPI000CF6218B|nr:uracil-DNA glycosylase family protein [Pseudoalteromonas sp. T1lg10]